MNDSSNWLIHEHREYEDLLRECQTLAGSGDWEKAAQRVNDLIAVFSRHREMEERILFPVYEEFTGIRGGPTRHLSQEHKLIERMLENLARSLERRDADEFLEASVPLGKAMALHHEKEEDFFLPMAGHVLLEKREEIVARFKELGGKRA